MELQIGTPQSRSRWTPNYSEPVNHIKIAPSISTVPASNLCPASTMGLEGTNITDKNPT